ncbi:MAG: hypothetical protein HY093_02720 [Candidatus Liptonbacteria bacterium]|nr:hypothetical protein [Candidatus Liptonbacteria bacterium]
MSRKRVETPPAHDFGFTETATKLSRHQLAHSGSSEEREHRSVGILALLNLLSLV